MKVLHHEQRPTYMPIAGTVAWVTALHYFAAPGWVWGVFFTLLAAVWTVALVRVLILTAPPFR